MIDYTNIIQSIFILINLLIIIVIFLKLIKYKNCGQVIAILNKNLDLLDNIYKRKCVSDLSNMIKLYSEVQTILKISESSSISLFKYNYSKKYLTLHFMFSINKNGEISHESYLDKLPATSNILNLEILKSENLTNITIDKLKTIDEKIYRLYKYNGIEKIYFKNISIKNDESPLGYLAFSYKDNYELNEEQEEEILRIINKISNLL